MSDAKITERCLKLGMSAEQAKQVVNGLPAFGEPDWSEATWSEIDATLRGVLAEVLS